MFSKEIKDSLRETVSRELNNTLYTWVNNKQRPIIVSLGTKEIVDALELEFKIEKEVS